MRTNLNNFLFIGDSYTERLSKIIKSNNDTVSIFALGGTTPGYWIPQIDSMPDDVEGIILLVGSNGVLEPSNIVDARILIDKICKKYPEKQLFIQKVFPVGENFYENKLDVIFRNNAINKYNEDIENFCKDRENIKIIDTRDSLVDEEGFLAHTNDQLHIAGRCNKTFYKNILEAVLKYY